MEQEAQGIVRERVILSWRGDDGREILKYCADMDAQDFRQFAAQEGAGGSQRLALNLAQFLEYRADIGVSLAEAIGEDGPGL